MNYLLDTNVISELITKQPYQPVLDWVDAQAANSLYLSVVTIGELQKGGTKLADSDRKLALQSWVTSDMLIRFQGHILTFDVETSLIWGNLTGRLAQVGRPLAALDSLIAAIALQHHCTIVTRNASDFADTGVALLNPWNAGHATLP